MTIQQIVCFWGNSRVPKWTKWPISSRKVPSILGNPQFASKNKKLFANIFTKYWKHCIPQVTEYLLNISKYLGLSGNGRSKLMATFMGENHWTFTKWLHASKSIKRFFFAKILVKINRFNCVIKLYMFYWVTITYPDVWYLDVITTRFTCTFLAIYHGPFLLPGWGFAKTFA